MAFFSSSCNQTKLNELFLFVIFCYLLLLPSVSSFEFQVGGGNGWVVPPSNDTRIYNDWASENRFQVGDTVRFTYSKDSVMEVNENDYMKCNSSHPSFFSNTGNTVYRLDRPGSFFFISGVSGHCGQGQKIIIKVMSSGDDPSKNSAHFRASMKPAITDLRLASLSFLLSYLIASLQL